jgi:hypothetical protein
MTPAEFSWNEVRNLNAEWARARAEGKDFRNLHQIARCSANLIPFA